MKQLDAEHLRRELIRATRLSLDEMGRSLAGERIYGVSLLMERLGSSAAFLAQSEEGLARSAAKNVGMWSAATGDLKSLIAAMQRWDCSTDWHYSDTHFAEANQYLAECYHSDPGEFFAAGCTRLVELCCLTTLAQLDVDRAFGNGSERERIVINLYFGDQGDEDLMGWATQVNPYNVAMRYAEELKVGHQAYASLSFVGPDWRPGQS